MFAHSFEPVEILDVFSEPDQTQESPLFAPIPEALADLQAGRMIVIVDDEDRENEGDLMIAAEMVTPEAINFMATRARGLICMAITSERAEALELSAMVQQNTSWGGTAFTVSVDAKGRGVTTGISVYDRAQTVLAVVDAQTLLKIWRGRGTSFRFALAEMVFWRGEVTPKRQSISLGWRAWLAGLNPSGVICEIANDDGGMACVPDLIRFCSKYALKMVSVADVALYRRGFARRAGEPTGIRALESD
jgi:3,4-dihydroxy 2-butanone 4-phosphate synthase/GTP cyclohydrolase II